MAEILLHDNDVEGFDMKNEKVEFALDMNKIWYESGNGWIPFKHYTFFTKLTWNRNDKVVVGFDVKAALSEFPLTWRLLWMDLTWKRKWLNFRYHDNVVDGFDMKNENCWILVRHDNHFLFVNLTRKQIFWWSWWESGRTSPLKIC